MLFNSLTFLLFFACVFALHALLPTWTGRKVLLLAASYLFYAAWHPPYVLILAFTTVLGWWLARLIWRTDDPAKRRDSLQRWSRRPGWTSADVRVRLAA